MNKEAHTLANRSSCCFDADLEDAGELQMLKRSLEGTEDIGQAIEQMVGRHSKDGTYSLM